MDSPLANLLGHHERVHLFLRDPIIPWVLSLGVRLAVTSSCERESNLTIRDEEQSGLELRDPVRMVCGEYGVVPVLLCFHAVGECEGRGEEEWEAEG